MSNRLKWTLAVPAWVTAAVVMGLACGLTGVLIVGAAFAYDLLVTMI